MAETVQSSDIAGQERKNDSPFLALLSSDPSREHLLHGGRHPGEQPGHQLSTRRGWGGPAGRPKQDVARGEGVLQVGLVLVVNTPVG